LNECEKLKKKKGRVKATGSKISWINLEKGVPRNAVPRCERASERRCIPVKSRGFATVAVPSSLVGEVIVLTGVYRSSTLCGYGGISH